MNEELFESGQYAVVELKDLEADEKAHVMVANDGITGVQFWTTPYEYFIFRNGELSSIPIGGQEYIMHSSLFSRSGSRIRSQKLTNGNSGNHSSYTVESLVDGSSRNVTPPPPPAAETRGASVVSHATYGPSGHFVTTLYDEDPDSVGINRKSYKIAALGSPGSSQLSQTAFGGWIDEACGWPAIARVGGGELGMPVIARSYHASKDDSFGEVLYEDKSISNPYKYPLDYVCNRINEIGWNAGQDVKTGEAVIYPPNFSTPEVVNPNGYVRDLNREGFCVGEGVSEETGQYGPLLFKKCFELDEDGEISAESWKSLDLGSILPKDPETDEPIWKIHELWSLSSMPKPRSNFSDEIRSFPMIGGVAERDGVRKCVLLLPVEFEIFERDDIGQIGGDRSPNRKAHTLDVRTRIVGDESQEERFYGEIRKCVSHVWDGNPVNLAKYLTGYDQHKDLYEDPETLTWHVKLPDGGVSNDRNLGLGSEPGEHEVNRFDVEVRAKGPDQAIDSLVISVIPQSTVDSLTDWFTAETAEGFAWFAELPAAYNALSSGNSDPEPAAADNWKDVDPQDSYYHPASYFEMRSEETDGGYGHQACYDDSGNIILDGISAGSADKVAPSKIQFWKAAAHRDADVHPFIWAAQLDGNPVQGEALNTRLSAPILHEGYYLDVYLHARPSNPTGTIAPGVAP